MKNKGDAVVAILVIACSAVLLVALVFAIGGNPFAEPRLRLSVDVEDAKGIKSRSDVTYAGQIVGRVTRVEPLRPGDRLPGCDGHVVRLHVAITEPVDLPANLKATIASTSMLGENQLSLSRVDDEGGKLADGAKLTGSAGSTLDSMVPGASDIVANLGNMVQKFGEVADGLKGAEDGANISVALENIQDASLELKEAFGGENGLAAIAKNLNETIEELRTLVAGGGDEPGLKAQLASAVENIESLTKGWNETFGKDEGINARLESIAKGLDDFVNGTRDKRALADQMASMAREIETLSREIQVFVVYAQYFGGSLAEKPRRLLFGDNDHLRIPTKEEIVAYLKENEPPYPVDLGEDFEAQAKKATGKEKEKSGGGTRPRRMGQKR